MLHARMPRTGVLIAALIALTAVAALLWAATAWASEEVTFSGLPTHHGGSEFSFTLTYNTDDHPTSYAAVRDSEVGVTNATVLDASRAHEDQADRNKVWSVTIEPYNGQADVTITVDDVSVTVPASAPPPPTPAVEDGAQLSDLPTHHGGNEFTLTVTFTGTPVSSWQTVQDSEVGVDGGTVVQVRRDHGTDAERNYVWAVTIDPDDDDVTITVRGESATVPKDEPDDAPGPVKDGNKIVPVEEEEPNTARQGTAFSFSVTSVDLEEGGSEVEIYYTSPVAFTDGTQLKYELSVGRDGRKPSVELTNHRPGRDERIWGQSRTLTIGDFISAGVQIQIWLRAVEDIDTDHETLTLTVSVESSTPDIADSSLTINVNDDEGWQPPPAGSPQRATRDLPDNVDVKSHDFGNSMVDHTAFFTYTISGTDANDNTRVRENLPRYFEVIYFSDHTGGMEGKSKWLEGNCEYQHWLFDPHEDADGNWEISLRVRVAMPIEDNRWCSRPGSDSRIAFPSSEFGTKTFTGEVYDVGETSNRGRIGGDQSTNMRDRTN